MTWTQKETLIDVNHNWFYTEYDSIVDLNKFFTFYILRCDITERFIVTGIMDFDENKIYIGKFETRKEAVEYMKIVFESLK